MPKVNVAHRCVAEGKPPVPTEVIAESIVEISKGMKSIRSGRLTDRALTILISESSRVSRTEVAKVLNALENLEAQYIRKAKA